MRKTESDLGLPRITFMIKYKLPPWIKFPFQKPKGKRSWAITVLLLLILPQSFIAPLLSGAVNWNPSSVPAGRSVQVNSTVPTADFSTGWYYYNLQPASNIKAYLRVAAGYASLTWADAAAVATNGTSITGNGCRHVVNNDGLPVNSTLTNATIPCIKIYNISWAMAGDEEPPRTVTNLVADAGPLGLVGDSPSSYYGPGQATVFNPDHLWNSSQNKFVPPRATFFDNTLKMSLLIIRDDTSPNCSNLPTTVFGDYSGLKQYLFFSHNRGNCYLIGNATFTAGVTTSPLSTYISTRVIEDKTPLNDVVLEPNPWVQESIWLLPDLMTMIAVMNSSLLPTWDNIDGYAEALLRQAYLAAWDMYHASFDMQGQLFNATPQESRIPASVSFSRVFSWLGISLLMTLGGILLLLMSLGYDEDEEPNLRNEIMKEGNKDVKR